MRHWLARGMGAVLALALLAGGAGATGTPVQAELRSTAVQAESLPPRVKVKGIYVSARTIGAGKRFEELKALVARTELNAMVIDIKDDEGDITFTVPNELAVSAGAIEPHIKDLPALVADLKARGIYTIARIVTFKDDRVATHRPDLAVQQVGGGTWRDRKGVAWLNPYNRSTWDYVLDISQRAAMAGFNEIQFDYVRFPTDGDLAAIVYPGKDDRQREQVIADFLAHARNVLRPYGVWTSADVFGLVTTSKNDMGIGQRLEEISAATDYVSPMVYPSHYSPGNLGLANPDAMPYDTVYRSMSDARTRWEAAGQTGKVQMRPWLQDFSMGHTYGPTEVRAQIQATYDAGYSEWLLWNAANVYTEAALKPEE